MQQMRQQNKTACNNKTTNMQIVKYNTEDAHLYRGDKAHRNQGSTP